MEIILIMFLGIFLIFTILKGILDDETDRLLVKFNNFNTRLIEEKQELYSRIDNRNKFIYEQQEKIKRQEEKIKDLENNVEFLFNNLSAQKKKLVRPDNQN